jgi:hypothetical protein
MHIEDYLIQMHQSTEKNIPITVIDDVKVLAAIFTSSKIFPVKAPIDAAPVAMAAVHGMNFLMTWNCTHIANAIISQAIQTICAQNGFNCPVICTPEELMGE